MSNHRLQKVSASINKPLQIDSHAIFQALRMGTVILSPDGIIQFINDEARKIIRTDSEIIGKPFSSLLHSKSRINFNNWFTKVSNDLSSSSTFLVSLKKGKDTISWINVHLSVLKTTRHEKLILCQLSDCTKNEEVEEAKKQHDHFLSELVNNIPDSIFIKDVKSRFILVNNAIAQRLGFKSPDDLIGKTDFDIHPKKLAQKYYYDEQEIIRTGEARMDIIEKVIDSKNNIAWHSTSKMPLKDQNGVIIGIMGIGRNITQLIKEQKVLRKAKLAAEKTDHLKTAFLSNFTHEIRTPLNGILGFSQYLKQTLRPEHKGHKYIDYILRNGKRLLHLISDIIDLSRIESGEISLIKKSFLLNEVMYQLKQSTLNQISSLNKEKIKLKLEIGLPDKESTIYADDSRLKQVLYNLLNNAVKFTESGTISFGYRVDKNMLGFYVKDTGIGIDSKDFKAIFESFRQVDNSQTRQYEGAGLGLTIAKGLIEIMDSKLTIISEPGKGSEFGFSIPMLKSRDVDQ